MVAELPAATPGIKYSITSHPFGTTPCTTLAILTRARGLFALLEASFLSVQQVIDLAYEHQQFLRVLLVHSLLAQPQ